MNWIHTLLGRAGAVDLSGPRLGIKSLRHDDTLICDLPDPLQQLFEIRERARADAQALIDKIHDLEAAFAVETDKKSVRPAYLEKATELTRDLLPLHMDYQIIYVLFYRELIDLIPVEKLREHKVLGVREGRRLVGRRRNDYGDLDEVDTYFGAPLSDFDISFSLRVMSRPDNQQQPTEPATT